MAKKIIIPPLVLEKAFAMYKQGYTYEIIAKNTGYSAQIIAHRCQGARLVRNEIKIKMSRKPGKYDHLFDEPVAEGRMYKDYVKK